MQKIQFLINVTKLQMSKQILMLNNQQNNKIDIKPQNPSVSNIYIYRKGNSLKSCKSWQNMTLKEQNNLKSEGKPQNPTHLLVFLDRTAHVSR